MKRTFYRSSEEYRYAWVIQICRVIDLISWFVSLGRYETTYVVEALCYDSLTEWVAARRAECSKS